MASSNIKVDVLGTSFSIQTNEDPVYFAGLMEYMKRTVDSVQKSTGVSDPLKTSILASLYIIDELFAEKKRKGELFDQIPQIELAEAEKIAIRIMKSLDEHLE